MNAPSSASDLFTNPKRFADLASWHQEADSLRAASPVHVVDRTEDGFRPFHAVLTHAAVMEVERQPELFTNHPDVALGRTKDLERQRAAGAAYFCLGAQLARMELRTLFRDLIPRLEHIELAEPPTSTPTTVVGGPKTLRINYQLTS